MLDFIDKTERLTHVAIAASLTGAEHMTWRTQRESDANANRMTMSMGNKEQAPVQTSWTAPRFV